jgi:hypothetical protein
MLKKRRFAYDGKGNITVESSDELSQAFATLGGKDLYAERWVAYTKELAVMVVRSERRQEVLEGTEVLSSRKEHQTSSIPIIVDGIHTLQPSTSSERVSDNNTLQGKAKKTKPENNPIVVNYPVVETIQTDHICHLVLAPAMVSETILTQCASIARAVVESLPSGRGLFGVELFLLPDDSVLINEIAPRSHSLLLKMFLSLCHCVIVSLCHCVIVSLEKHTIIQQYNPVLNAYLLVLLFF